MKIKNNISKQVKNIPMKTIYLCLVLLLTLNITLPGQTRKTKKSKQTPVKQEISQVNIGLIARSYGDSIVLRWAYTEAYAFRTFNESGFILERLSLDKDNKVLESSFQKLTSQPVKPWTLDQWEKAGIQKDDYAAVAAQALYGKSFAVDESMGEIEVMQNMADDAKLRHAFSMLAADLSPMAANGLGLRYTDRDIKPDRKYIYRIYSPHENTFFNSDTAQFVIAVKDKYMPVVPYDIKAIEGDMTIVLKWPQEQFFSGYYIEKSTNGGKSFKRLNEKPYVKIATSNTEPDLVFVDSLDANYKPCIYRISGISPFGDVSPWSQTIKAMGRDRTPPVAPLIKEAKRTEKGNVKITWTMDEVSPDLSGFYIGSSNNVNGPFMPEHKKPIPKQTRTYTITTPLKEGGRYYVVVSVDTAKNVQQSMPAYVFVPDDIPPVKPQKLSGNIDMNGLVMLTWPMGPDKDLNGYRVYRGSERKGTYLAITGTIQDTSFTDTITLNTLNEYVFYKIVAIDHSYNNSEYSDALQLEIPDTIAPVTPVFKKYIVTDSTVYLEWNKSSSTDVVKQTLSRREKNGEWNVIMKFDKAASSYTDINVSKNKMYEYTLIAEDDAGLRSYVSEPVKIKVFDPGISDNISGFNAGLSEDKQSVELSWKPLNNKTGNILIYRSFNGSALSMYASVDAEDVKYTDTGTKQKGEYKYAVRVVYKNGSKSIMSGEKKIEIQ